MRALSRSIYCALVVILTSSQAYAGACFPAGEGAQVTWNLAITPVTTEHQYSKRITVPLVRPEQREVEVGRYWVFAKLSSTGSTSTHTFGQAVWDAFEALEREPDKLVAYLYSDNGRALFESSCMGKIQQDMTAHELRAKKVDFYGIAEVSRKQQSSHSPWRPLETCLIQGPQGRMIELEIHAKTEKRLMRQRTQSAGRMVVDFTVSSQGTVNNGPDMQTRFRVAAQPARAKETPAGLESAARIKVAGYDERIAGEIETLQNELNAEHYSLSPADQERLCNDEGGELTKEVAFRVFDRDYQSRLLVTARKQITVNSPLGGDKCERINCDCENLDAGILSREWRAECRNEQTNAIRSCKETGQIHRCRYMVGPNPSYPE